jgi:hypothetical protein
MTAAFALFATLFVGLIAFGCDMCQRLRATGDSFGSWER